jgi:NAD dependent epimerase/dehydratase family enzyme
MTMSTDKGGVFDTLLGLVRHGLGGREGDGRQFVSWIHDYDFIRAIYWIIEQETVEGAVNLTAPNPLPNAEFLATLRSACGTKIGLPAADWMLEVGTLLLQTETELVLKSRRVIPTRLLQSGFEFDFPNWTGAAGDLCRRWRNSIRTV